LHAAGSTEVFEHLATCLLAAAALVGALLHHRVRRPFFALVAAALAGVGARLTDEVRKGAGLGRDARGRPAHRLAVLAGPKGHEVVLLPVRQHGTAVVGTLVTRQRTLAARLGAVREFSGVSGSRSTRLAGRERQGSETDHGRIRNSD